MADLFIGVVLGTIVTMVFDKWKEAKDTIYGTYELDRRDDTIIMKMNSEQIIKKRSKIVLLPRQTRDKHVL